ncbi:uncharacterized protein ARMOST_14524 [Armillaria ostoyae]|uniref:Uncharacterized protein n=1 Tax=Armillaria ostoyae TaxID=47428 RepID=A0A284RQT8_ARMOS|nr:uncharacterized protein ARMOST_14524 [Armillaria ostoyae]
MYLGPSDDVMVCEGLQKPNTGLKRTSAAAVPTVLTVGWFRWCLNPFPRALGAIQLNIQLLPQLAGCTAASISSRAPSGQHQFSPRCLSLPTFIGPAHIPHCLRVLRVELKRCLALSSNGVLFATHSCRLILIELRRRT